MQTLGSKIINSIIEYEQINANQFAERIGLLRTQPIYDLINGKVKKVTPNYAKKILAAYPYYNYNWLLTGEGEMLKTGKQVNDSPTTVSSKPAVPYEFVEALFEERKRADEQRFELMRQNAELITIVGSSKQNIADSA